MEQEFSNKVAMVTGGASGIGAAISERLFAAGASLIIVDIDAPAARALATRLDSRGRRALGLATDVADAEAVRAAVDCAVERFGGLHIAVNNAGILGAARTPLIDVTVAEFQRIFDVNVTGVFHGLKFQIPAIIASGGGAIVNMGSVASSVAQNGYGAYVATKHAVLGLTRAAALENSSSGVRINAVGPGVIGTPIMTDTSPEFAARWAALHPIGRIGQASEVAELVAFLLSDRASFITGSYNLVDGGYTIV